MIGLRLFVTFCGCLRRLNKFPWLFTTVCRSVTRLILVLALMFTAQEVSNSEINTILHDLLISWMFTFYLSTNWQGREKLPSTLVDIFCNQSELCKMHYILDYFFTVIIRKWSHLDNVMMLFMLGHDSDKSKEPFSQTYAKPG